MADEQRRFDHTPVMVERVTALLAPVPPGTFVDATLGGGGHARAVLEANPGLTLLGLDRDPAALDAAGAALAPFGDRVRFHRGRFDELPEAVERAGARPVTGVLFDLGVSSPQLDRPERGFSFRHDGPLDMRMDPDGPTTASDVVNTWDQAELAEALRRLGDERFAARVAAAIVAARPLRSTTELAEVVRNAIPAATRRSGGHPAKRTFQALRIVVNDELEILPGTLDRAIEVLAPGGRIVVLAYHSGEDRIVKRRFDHAATGGCTCPPGLPCACGARPTVRLLRRGGWTPDAAEVAANPRAASARIRAAEKLHDETGDRAA
jgi:16S rRNA (cytosine1402-N4)-methyltransferase